MPVTCRDIINCMEKMAPKKLAEDWDAVGLAVGDPSSEVKRILVALDVTADVIDEAIQMQADMIITHHPMLLFQKIKSITPDTPLGSKIYQLIRHNISAFSAHTNLDIVFGGTNDVLAKLAGLEDIEILKETSADVLKKIVVYVPVTHEEVVREALCCGGAGHIGNYACCTFGAKGKGTFLPLDGAKPFLGSLGNMEQVEEIRMETIVPAEILEDVIGHMLAAHPYEEVAYDIYDVEQKGKRYGIGRIGNLKTPMTFEEYAMFLKKALGLDSIRLVGDRNKMIRRVGLCTGSGVEYMNVAHHKGADAYITGDIKFHEAQRALEMGICVADATHYASEVLVVPVIKQYIEEEARKNGWNIEVKTSQKNGQTFWNC
jgi:dinuclear metal center YbgI/SA1388 family protein